MIDRGGSTYHGPKPKTGNPKRNPNRPRVSPYNNHRNNTNKSSTNLPQIRKIKVPNKNGAFNYNYSHTVKTFSGHTYQQGGHSGYRQNKVDFPRFERFHQKNELEYLLGRMEGQELYKDPKDFVPGDELTYDFRTGVNKNFTEAVPLMLESGEVPEKYLDAYQLGKERESGRYSYGKDDKYFKKLFDSNYDNEQLFNKDTQSIESTPVMRLDAKAPEITMDVDFLGKYWDDWVYEVKGHPYLKEGAPMVPVEFDEDGNITKKYYDYYTVNDDGTYEYHTYSDEELKQFNEGWIVYRAFNNAQSDLLREDTERMEYTAGWDPEATDSVMDWGRDTLSDFSKHDYEAYSRGNREGMHSMVGPEATTRMFKNLGGYFKNYLFTPLLHGDIQTATLNGLVNLGETCDYAGVGTRALLAPKLGIEYDEGDSAFERVVKAYTTHTNYDPDTGSALKDIGIYMLDPSIVTTLGGIGLAKLSSRIASKAALKALDNNLIKYGEGLASKKFGAYTYYAQNELVKKYKAISRDLAFADDMTITQHAEDVAKILEKSGSKYLQNTSYFSVANDVANDLRALQNKKAFFFVNATAASSDLVNKIDNVFLAGGLYLPYSVLKTVQGTRSILRNNQFIAEHLTEQAFKTTQNAKRIFKNFGGPSIMDFHSIIEGFKNYKSLDNTDAYKTEAINNFRKQWLEQQSQLESILSRFKNSTQGLTNRVSMLNYEISRIFKVSDTGDSVKNLTQLKENILKESSKARGINQSIDDIFDNILKTITDAEELVTLARTDDADKWITAISKAESSVEVLELYKLYLKDNSEHPIAGIEDIASDRFKTIKALEDGISEDMVAVPDDMLVVNSVSANNLDSVPLSDSHVDNASIYSETSNIPHLLCDAHEANKKAVEKVRKDLEDLIEKDTNGNIVRDSKGSVKFTVDNWYVKDLYNYLSGFPGDKISLASLDVLDSKISRALDSLKGKFYGTKDAKYLPNAEEIISLQNGLEDTKDLFVYSGGLELQQKLVDAGALDYYRLVRTHESPIKYLPEDIDTAPYDVRVSDKSEETIGLEFYGVKTPSRSLKGYKYKHIHERGKATEEAFRKAKRISKADPNGVFMQKMKLRHQLKGTIIKKEDGIVVTAWDEYEKLVGEYNKYLVGRGETKDLVSSLEIAFFDIKDATALTKAQAEKAYEINMAMSAYLEKVMANPIIMDAIHKFDSTRPLGFLIDDNNVKEIFEFLNKNLEAGRDVPMLNKFHEAVDTIATWHKALTAYSNFNTTLKRYKLSPREAAAVREVVLGNTSEHFRELVSRNSQAFFDTLEGKINEVLGMDNLLINGYRESILRTTHLDESIWRAEHFKYVRACEDQLADISKSDVKIQILQDIELDPNAIKRFNELAKQKDVYFIKTITDGNSPDSAIVRIELQKWVPIDEDASLPDVLKVLQDSDNEYTHIFEISEKLTEKNALEQVVDLLDKGVKSGPKVKRVVTPHIVTHGRDWFDIDVLRRGCYRNEVVSASLSDTNMLFRNRTNTFKELMKQHRDHNCIDPDKIPGIAEAVSKLNIDLPEDPYFGIFNVSKFGNDLEELFDILSDNAFFKEVGTVYDSDNAFMKMIMDSQDDIKALRVDNYDLENIIDRLSNEVQALHVSLSDLTFNQKPIREQTDLENAIFGGYGERFVYYAYGFYDVNKVNKNLSDIFLGIENAKKTIQDAKNELDGDSINKDIFFNPKTYGTKLQNNDTWLSDYFATLSNDERNYLGDLHVQGLRNIHDFTDRVLWVLSSDEFFRNDMLFNAFLADLKNTQAILRPHVESAIKKALQPVLVSSDISKPKIRTKAQYEKYLKDLQENNPLKDYLSEFSSFYSDEFLYHFESFINKIIDKAEDLKYQMDQSLDDWDLLKADETNSNLYSDSYDFNNEISSFLSSIAQEHDHLRQGVFKDFISPESVPLYGPFGTPDKPFFIPKELDELDKLLISSPKYSIRQKQSELDLLKSTVEKYEKGEFDIASLTSSDTIPRMKEKIKQLESEMQSEHLDKQSPSIPEITEPEELEENVLTKLNALKNDLQSYIEFEELNIDSFENILHSFARDSDIPESVINTLVVAEGVFNVFDRMLPKEIRQYKELIKLYTEELSSLSSKLILSDGTKGALSDIFVLFNQKSAILQEEFLKLQKSVTTRSFQQALNITETSPFIKNIFEPVRVQMQAPTIRDMVKAVKEEVKNVDHIRDSQLASCLSSREFEGYGELYGRYDFPMGTSAKLQLNVSGDAFRVGKAYNIDNISTIANLDQYREGKKIIHKWSKNNKPVIDTINKASDLLQDAKQIVDDLDEVNKSIDIHQVELDKLNRTDELISEREELIAKYEKQKKDSTALSKQKARLDKLIKEELDEGGFKLYNKYLGAFAELEEILKDAFKGGNLSREQKIALDEEVKRSLAVTFPTTPETAYNLWKAEDRSVYSYLKITRRMTNKIEKAYKRYNKLLYESGPFAKSIEKRIAKIDTELENLPKMDDKYWGTLNYHENMLANGKHNKENLEAKNQQVMDELITYYEWLKNNDVCDDIVVKKSNLQQLFSDIQYVIENTDIYIRIPVQLDNIPAHELKSLNKFANRIKYLREYKYRTNSFLNEVSTLEDWNKIINQTKKFAIGLSSYSPYHWLVYLKEPDNIEDAFLMADLLYNTFYKKIDDIKRTGLSTVEQNRSLISSWNEKSVNNIMEAGFNSVDLNVPRHILKILQGDGLDLVYKGFPKSYLDTIYHKSKITGKHAASANIADIIRTKEARQGWASKFAASSYSEHSIRENIFDELENSQIDTLNIIKEVSGTPYEAIIRRYNDACQEGLLKAQHLRIMDFISRDEEHLLTHLLYHNGQMVIALNYSDEVYGKFLTKLKSILNDNPLYITYKENKYDGQLWIGLSNDAKPRILGDTKYLNEDTQIMLGDKVYNSAEMNEFFSHWEDEEGFDLLFSHIDLPNYIDPIKYITDEPVDKLKVREYCTKIRDNYRKAYEKINFLTEGAVKGSAMVPYTLAKHQALRKAAPIDWLADTLRSNVSCDQRMFHTSQFDFNIIGEKEYRFKLGGLYDDSDILQNIKHVYDDLAGTVSTERMFIANYFDDNSHCKFKNILGNNLTTAEKLDILQRNPDQCVLILKEDKHTMTGFRVEKLKIRDELSIRQAEAAEAIIADYETYVEMTKVINNSQFDKAIAKVWAKVVFFLKVGHLCNPGTWFRNWLDATIKATGETGSIGVTAINQVKATTHLIQYNKIIKYVRDTYGVHHNTSKRIANEWESIQNATGTSITKEQFDFLEDWLKVTLSGGESHMLREMLKKQKYDPWRSGNLKPGDSFSYPGVEAMQKEFDYIGSEVYRFEQIGETEIKNLIEEGYLKGEEVFVEDFSADDFWRIFNQRKNPNTTKIEDSDLWYKYKDTAENILKIRMRNLYRKNRGVGSKIDYMCSCFLKPMSMVEQVVRLGQFMALEKQGYTRSEIFKSIADTQFEYELKSSKVRGAELVMTYFNFEYNNLRYWCNLLEQQPEYLYLLESLWNDLSWEAAQDVYEDEQFYNNPSLAYMMANGALPIGSSGLYLKMFPSALGALNWFYGAPSQFFSSVVPPAEVLLKEFAFRMGGDYAEWMSNMDYNYADEKTWEKALSMVPIAGTIYTRYVQHYKERQPWTRLDEGTIEEALVKYNPTVWGAIYQYNKPHKGDLDTFQKNLAKQGKWYDCNIDKVVSIDKKNTRGLNDPKLHDDFNRFNALKQLYQGVSWDANWGGFKKKGHFTTAGSQYFDSKGNPKNLGLNRYTNLSAPGEWERLKRDRYLYHHELWDRNTDEFIPASEWKEEKLNRSDLTWQEVQFYMAEKGKYWDPVDHEWKHAPEVMHAYNQGYYNRGYKEFKRWVNYGNNPPADSVHRKYSSGNTFNVSGKPFSYSYSSSHDYAALRMAVSGYKAYEDYYKFDYKYNYSYRNPNPISRVRGYNPIIRYHIIPS